jgi:hypothetical protein
VQVGKVVARLKKHSNEGVRQKSSDLRRKWEAVLDDTNAMAQNRSVGYVCVCVCIDIYIYSHTCIHTYIHTYLPTYIRTIPTCMLYVYTRTHMHACIHTYIHTHIHEFVHAMSAHACILRRGAPLLCRTKN